MLTALLIFAAQFVYIMLLGLQQLNVVGKHYVGAATVSLALGVFGYHLTATIAIHAEGHTFGLVWWGYVLAGPIAICTAMAIHPFFKKWLTNGK